MKIQCIHLIIKRQFNVTPKEIRRKYLVTYIGWCKIEVSQFIARIIFTSKGEGYVN